MAMAQATTPKQRYLEQVHVGINFGNNLRPHLRADVHLDTDGIRGECPRVVSELEQERSL